MRRAFTVVELLVVIAIIGVLVALIVPAVQHAREAARKTNCSANLKQIAMAAIAHNTTFEYFPNAGGVDGASRSVNAAGIPYNALRQDWGVFYQLLPYIEQRAAYDLVNPAEVAAQPVKTYFCPTRGGARFTSGSTANGLAAADKRSSVDYAGNGGQGGDPTTFAPYIQAPPGSAMQYTNSLSNQTGVIIPRPLGTNTTERITGSSIRDGLSNVLMFGERNYHRKPPATTQLDEDNGFINGWSQDTIRWAITTGPRPDRVAVLMGPGSTGDLRFGGPHSGIVMLAFCDGSTRAFRYGDADDLAFRQLTHRYDKKFPQVGL